VLSPYQRILLASFCWGIGGQLNWLFLNFHLEGLRFSRAEIGWANAMPALAAVAFCVPLAMVIPRVGYVRSLLLGGFLGVLGMLGVASGMVVYPGLLLSGLAQGLVMGSVAPLMARWVSNAERVKAFSTQAALGQAAGFIGSGVGGQLPALIGQGSVMYVAALAMVFSTLCLVGFPETRGELKAFAFKNRRNWVLLLIPQTLVGIGAGLVMPFINLYMQGKFNLSYSSIGWLFAVTSLTGMLTVLIQPFLAKRLGKVGAINAVQAASLPFLAILAWGPWLPMVIVALFVRGALMNSAGPVYTALMMDHLDDEERSGFLLIQGALWQLAWAISSAFSGRLQQDLGIGAFNWLFVGMLALYSSAILYYPLFFKPRKSSSRTTQMDWV
jgi:MFS family permease